MSLTAACHQALWWRQIQRELQPQLNSQPTTIHLDNLGAQLLAFDASVYHPRTKHIDIRHHVVREHWFTNVNCNQKILKV